MDETCRRLSSNYFLVLLTRGIVYDIQIVLDKKKNDIQIVYKVKQNGYPKPSM